jgi:hypothetical protein
MSPSGSNRASLTTVSELDLAEVLDRTLGAGVVLEGDVTLSVADVELVYLNLRALLASVATLEARGIPFASHGSHPAGAYSGSPSGEAPARREPRPAGPRPGIGTGLLPESYAPRRSDPSADRGDRLERGLAQLVLTVVELLRKLMERQALRRVDAGLLEPEQVERLGLALDRLERQMDELKERFEVDDDDLTLRLGPLPAFELPDGS